MSKKIAFITDSTASIPDHLLEKHNIHVVSLSINFGEEDFLETHMPMDQFINKMNTSKDFPRSSQPAVGSYIELYESLKQDYDLAISIHLSSKLSGTSTTAQMAAGLVDFPVYVIDSTSTSFPMADLVISTVEYYEKGHSLPEILSFIEERKAKHGAFVLVDKLDQLHRGGRVSGTQFLVGNLLKIKPILYLQHGVIEPYEKIRGNAKAAKRVFELFDDVVKKHPDIKAVVIYFGDVSITSDWINQLQSIYPDLSFEPYPLSSVIGVHSGENALGIAWTYA